MAKHILTARLGLSDTETLTASPEESLTEVKLVDSDGYWLHGLGAAIRELNELGIYPSEAALELYILAVLVFAADTRISRATESEDGWTREIGIILPVRNQEHWQQARDTIQTLLGFLTGDIWSVEFRSYPSELSLLPSKPLVPVEPLKYTSVSLFSGGLDSLIGAIDQLSDGEIPMLVSHAGEGATSEAQHDCIVGLRREMPGSSFERLRVWLQFDKNLFPGIPADHTTRARSFLFFAAGVLAATGLGDNITLRVPENGFIALNIPLDTNRLGALSTRTTHPYYIARWRDLLTKLGIPINIHNPYWNATKGDMVSGCKNVSVLEKILPLSMSCSSPTKGRWKGLGVQHCGYCLPCLIRRAALQTGLPAGVQDPTLYSLSDLTAKALLTRRSEGVQIRSFQVAIERLSQKPSLAKLLIHKTGSLSDVSDDLDALASVYSRGMAEVGALLKNVVTIPR